VGYGSAMSDELEQFAELLVRNVRDAAIRQIDRARADRGPLGDRWRQAEQLSAPDAIHELTPDIVDEVVFHLLDSLDNDRLPLAWLSDDGEAVQLSELGSAELGGWYAGGEWRSRFSSERWTDLFPDLEFASRLTSPSRAMGKAFACSGAHVR
jgi:hypothetical protein